MRYAISFALSIICLTVGAMLTFDRLSIAGVNVGRRDSLAAPPADTLPTPQVATPLNPSAADYARFAEADRAWREKHARQYTIPELRIIGDGRRTSRDSVQDRVFLYVRSNQRARAIAELERWVTAHPNDGELLLSLARLLSEEGRSGDAVGRYRQILALQGKSHGG